MKAYAEFHGQILQEVTGIHINGKTYSADQVVESLPRIQAQFVYKNYKGETEARKVYPIGLFYGTTPYHPEQQWFMRAFDIDRNAERDFALKDMGYRPPAEALAPLVAIADAYDANDLDDEARKYWTWGENTTPPEDIELYTGRGGKRLLTLADCLKAREFVR